ncbi:MAG: DMT family transporter [Thiobacillaceae bacterium]
MKSAWMLVAAALFGVMGALVKIAAADFSSADLVFYRSVFGLVAIYFIILLRTRSWTSALATIHWRAHLHRALAGFAALALFFYAVAHLPLPTAVTLNYTAPLFLAVITTLWLGERHARTLGLAIALGFVGVVVLLAPGMPDQDGWAMWMGLASGLLAAVAYLNVRALGRLGEPEWRVVFYFALISTLGAAVWMAWQGTRWPSPMQLPLLLAIGVTATLAQLAMTRAYRLGNTLVVGSLAYATVGFSALYGRLLFHDRLSVQSWGGMGLIVAAGLFATRLTSVPVVSGASSKPEGPSLY